MSGVAVKVLAADVLARLQGMEARGGNLSAVFRNFGGHMISSIQKNFDAEGRPVKWPALQVGSLLSWSYGFKKGGTHRTKKGGPTKAGRAALAGRKILTRDSYLRNSVAPLNITANSILIGTNMDYAAIHQFGGKAGRDKKVSIPARPYLMFQDEDVNYLEMTLVNYVLTGRI